MSTTNVAILLLAAGSSSRMGQSKQLLTVDGKSLLRKMVEVALAAKTDGVVVVLGANEALHRNVIRDLAVEIVTNENWQKGMGSSLKAGLHQARKVMPSLKAIVVMVCDQPNISTDHLSAIIRQFRTTGRSIASSYGNTAGVPALFDAALFQKLFALPDEQGAKKIITEESLDLIEFPHGAVDLDTEQDYEDFLKGNRKKD